MYLTSQKLGTTKTPRTYASDRKLLGEGDTSDTYVGECTGRASAKRIYSNTVSRLVINVLIQNRSQNDESQRLQRYSQSILGSHYSQQAISIYSTESVLFDHLERCWTCRQCSAKAKMKSRRQWSLRPRTTK